MWAKLVIAAMLLPAVAFAETPVEKAGRLFDEGRAQLKRGNYREACTAFEESRQLDPQLGVLFNLATCREQLGQLATALELYRELALIDTKADRRREAEHKARALAPRIPKLVVKVDVVAGVTIAIDGKDTTAMRGLPVPVDLGTHAVVVRADGYPEWQQAIAVTEEGKVIDVAVTLITTAPPDATDTDKRAVDAGTRARRDIALAPDPIPAPPPRDPPRATEKPSRLAPKVVAISGFAVGAIGIGVVLQAKLGPMADYENSPPAVDVDDPRRPLASEDCGNAEPVPGDSAERWKRACAAVRRTWFGAAATVVGVGVGVGAVIYLVTRDQDRVQVTPAASSTSVGATLSVRW